MNNLKALIQSLKLNKLDSAIIESPYNRRYFLGFKSTAGVLFVTSEKAYFLIDFRYFEKASSLLVDPCIEVVLLEKMSEQLNEIIKKHKIKEIAIESHFMSIFKADEYKKS